MGILDELFGKGATNIMIGNKESWPYQYCQYIHNAGRGSIEIAKFDEDWEPIGFRLRSDLMAAGLATQDPLIADSRKIHLTPQGYNYVKYAMPPVPEKRRGAPRPTECMQIPRE